MSSPGHALLAVPAAKREVGLAARNSREELVRATSSEGSHWSVCLQGREPGQPE